MKNSKKTLRKVVTFLLLIVDPILLVITFACPFVFEHFENACSELPNGFLFAVQIVIAIILLLVSIAKAIIDAFRNKKHRKNVRSRLILSHMNLLFDLKGEMIRDSTYHPYIKNNYSPLFYNVHGYIRDVCKNLRDTVAAIIETESEYVDVALIYHYQGSDNWEWLSGKSGTSGAMSLNEFIQGPTLFNYVIKEKQIVFENDKEQCKFYLPKRRDRFFNNKGSIMAMPLTYFNNKDGLIDFVLVISTYGVRFVESGSKESIKNFREILVYEILPYYISHLQVAFGEMYLWNVRNNSAAQEKDSSLSRSAPKTEERKDENPLF